MARLKIKKEDGSMEVLNEVRILSCRVLNG